MHVHTSYHQSKGQKSGVRSNLSRFSFALLVFLCVCSTGDMYLTSQGIAHSSTWDIGQNILGISVIALLSFTCAYIQLRRTKKYKWILWPGQRRCHVHVAYFLGDSWRLDNSSVYRFWTRGFNKWRGHWYFRADKHKKYRIAWIVDVQFCASK